MTKGTWSGTLSGYYRHWIKVFVKGNLNHLPCLTSLVFCFPPSPGSKRSFQIFLKLWEGYIFFFFFLKFFLKFPGSYLHTFYPGHTLSILSHLLPIPVDPFFFHTCHPLTVMSLCVRPSGTGGHSCHIPMMAWPFYSISLYPPALMVSTTPSSAIFPGSWSDRDVPVCV